MTAIAKPDAIDAMFRAVSDRTRLRIVHLLRAGEVCVCDLVGVLGVPQPKVSRHLAYLRRAGLVNVRKDGLWSYYRLAAAKSAFHRKLLECLATCLSHWPEATADARVAKVAKARGTCC